LVILCGEVLDAIQATNAGNFKGNPVHYTLPQHGGTGGSASTASTLKLPAGKTKVPVPDELRSGTWPGRSMRSWA
jgi:hypothetical protein